MKFSILALVTLVTSVIAAPVADADADVMIAERDPNKYNKCDKYKIDWEQCKKNEYDYEHKYHDCNDEYEHGDYKHDKDICDKDIYEAKHKYESCKKHWGLLGLIKCKIELLFLKKLELKCKLIYLKHDKFWNKCEDYKYKWLHYKEQCPIKEHEYKSCKPY